MEKPKNPWAPSQDRLDFEFQQKSIRDLEDLLDDFGEKHDIQYDIDESRGHFQVKAVDGDFDSLRKYCENVVGILNKTLENHKKGFLFVVVDDGGGFAVKAVRRQSKEGLQ